ncbi:hypothetical protein KR084_004033, partial [Drosophila pseudotakahashii]
LRLLQINLHHSKAASAALLLRLAKGKADVVLVQEPCIAGGKVAGLGTKEYKLMLDPKEGKIPACILAKRHLSTFLLRNYSNGDNTAISLELRNGSIRLLSAYLAFEKVDPPDALVRGLVKEYSFLLAFQRFVGRRGCPQVVHCDNGTNFVGASRHFQALRERIEVEADAIREFASRSGCEFAFTPPRAPHMGGLWEAVRQMFWRRWSREYVLGLQIRGKWHQQKPNISEGDLVVVAEDNLPPQQWLLGKIVA